MVRRWMIRSFFLALLLLSAGAWVASYQHSIVLSYSRTDVDAYTLGIDQGLAECSNSGSNLSGWHLDVDWDDDDPFELPTLYPRTKYRYGGFAYCANFFNLMPGKGWIVICPFWFLTGISGVLLCWVWRRTRNRVPKVGFPVVLPVASAM